MTIAEKGLDHREEVCRAVTLEAGRLALDWFERRSSLEVALKGPQDYASEADAAVERVVRGRLAEAFPEDAFLGEEEGGEVGERVWVVDPIDGTANFVRGVPVWATLIALMVEGEVKVGVVSAPALGRRWWASAGGGAYSGKTLMQGQPCHVSGVGSMDDASLSYSSIHGWVETSRGQQFVDLMRGCWRTRAYGDFWSYMLLAEGSVDIATEPELALHDMAALDVIVREAGGRFTNLDGADGPHGPGAIATNGLLHDAVVQQLAE